jgi:hypothetical protein
MRTYLLLFMVAVTALGGCTSCDDAPGPQRSHKFDIYIEESFDINAQMAPYLTRDSTVRRVNTVYSYGAARPKFTCSDQNWDIYEWHFGNGQVFTGKGVSPYFGAVNLSDTLTLRVYSNDRKDSAQASMRFNIKSINYWPHLGNYRGRLWYIDRYIADAEIEFRADWNPDRSAFAIQAVGLYKSACGLPDTIYFDFVGNNQIYQRSFGSNERGWMTDIDYAEECRFVNTFAYQNTGHYFTFKGDSLKLLSVRWDKKIEPGKEQFVTFKGKKL